MTTSGGRKTISYLVKCALAANDSLVKQDQNGNNYTFAGGIGLCPAWKNGGVYGNAQCMEGISACMMAHVNTAGVHVPALARLERLRHRLGHRSRQLPDAGGDLLRRHHRHRRADQPLQAERDRARSPTTATAPGFPAGANGVVAGRLGANQTGAPYVNPFGNGTLCQNAPGAVGQFSQGVGGSCPRRLELEPRGRLPRRLQGPHHQQQRRRLAARHHRVAQQQLHAGVRPVVHLPPGADAGEWRRVDRHPLRLDQRRHRRAAVRELERDAPDVQPHRRRQQLAHRHERQQRQVPRPGGRRQQPGQRHPARGQRLPGGDTSQAWTITPGPGERRLHLQERPGRALPGRIGLQHRERAVRCRSGTARAERTRRSSSRPTR